MADPRDPNTTEAVTGAALARATVPECRLSIIAGDDRGAVHTFAAARTVIGADPRADLVIRDRAMSRFHCELELADGVWVVRDLGSRNGTLIDNVPVFEAPLRDGSVLTCGRTQLSFEIGARRVELTLSTADHFGRLLGASVAMRAVYPLLEAAAESAATVLLQGESGTGKDLAAEAIHDAGDRRDGPFVVVDCGALPANLLETELFGYEAGAFTGADRARPGALEAADGGTLLLDEIGELSIDLQPKLLRVIDRREIQRVGGTERRPVDVRIIAATHRDLKRAVNGRQFRADLYFRLAVLVVRMPPLRERTSDIPGLVDAILGDLGDGDSEVARSLRSGELTAQLMRHSWPGNVRELRNYVEAAVARQEASLDVAGMGELGEPSLDVDQPLGVVRERWARYVERRYLQQLLAAHGGNVSAAARAAGVDRSHLHRLLRRIGLR